MGNRGRENPIKKLGDLSPNKAISEAARHVLPSKKNARTNEANRIARELNRKK